MFVFFHLPTSLRYDVDLPCYMNVPCYMNATVDADILV